MNVQMSPVHFWQEAGRFVARCLATGTVSEGLTQEEALERLRQGVTLYHAGAGITPLLVPAGDLGYGPWCPSSVSWRQVVERLARAGFERAGESEGHIKFTKVITSDNFLATLKVMVPRAADGEELAVGSLRAVLEQALMDRTQFDGLAEPQEVPSSLDLRITPELRARIQNLTPSEGGDS